MAENLHAPQEPGVKAQQRCERVKAGALDGRRPLPIPLLPRLERRRPACREGCCGSFPLDAPILMLVRHRAITGVSPRCHRASAAPRWMARLIRRIRRAIIDGIRSRGLVYPLAAFGAA